MDIVRIGTIFEYLFIMKFVCANMEISFGAVLTEAKNET